MAKANCATSNQKEDERDKCKPETRAGNSTCANLELIELMLEIGIQRNINGECYQCEKRC